MKKFIVFEGADGSGKTTVLKEVQRWLRARYPDEPFLQTREAGGTDIGRRLRTLLLETKAEGEQLTPIAELLLYMADRSQHHEWLVQALNRYHVLCDRYCYSTVAYQSYGRGLELALVNRLNNLTTDGLRPDLIVWLDISPELGLMRSKQRGELDRLEQEDLSFHWRVRTGYEAQFSEQANVLRVDASKSLEEVLHLVTERIATCLELSKVT